MIFAELIRRAAPFRDVLGFTFRQWQRQGLLTWTIAITIMLSTLAEVLLPLYAGHLVDAV